MERELLHILQHSLGVDQYGQGEQYRNHFATCPSGKDFSKCCQLVDMGFMEDLGVREIWGDMHCFIVTSQGVDAVTQESPAPPKVSRSKQRYRRFLEYGDGFDSFLDYCRWDSEPERSWNSGR